MRDQKGDKGNRTRRTRPDAGPLAGDGLLPQNRHMQHFTLAS
jgi:hypothetical protein